MKTKNPRLNILIWFSLMTVNSGFINSMSIIRFAIPTSHHTGNVTNLALNLAANNHQLAIQILLAILCFILGGIIAGFTFYKKQVGISTAYGKVLIASGLSIMLIYIIASLEIRLYYSAFILGLQNGILTRYRGLVIRTTHISGNITDAAVGIGKFIHGEKGELWKVGFLLSLVFSFFIGSFIAYFTSMHSYLNLSIIAGLLILYTGVHYYFFILKKDSPSADLS